MSNFVERFDQMSRTVERYDGLNLLFKTEYHWQIRGGPYLVNVYPSKQSIHVDGMIRKLKYIGSVSGFAKFCIRGALEPPKKIPKHLQALRPPTGWSKQKRKEIFAQGKTRCKWCNALFLTPEEATLEHVIPLCRGGSATHGSNLALACDQCNQEHGDGTKLEKADRNFR